MKWYAWVSLGIGIVLLLGVAVMAQKTPSPDTVQDKMFSYMASHVQENGLVLSEPNKTTSESQSYMMLSSLTADRKDIFDIVWKWTRENLQTRPEDKLFSWLWVNGQIQDAHSATDADQDIALALILAGDKWGGDEYTVSALEILKNIWEKDTRVINGVRYVTAGDWGLDDPSGVVLNPSYFAPYAYRIFALTDPFRDWNSLVDSSYDALKRCSGPSGIASDWCRLDLQGNRVAIGILNGKEASLFSYDALRVPYRVALDWRQNNEPRAKDYLQSTAVFLKDWIHEKKLYAAYTEEAQAAVSYEALAQYGSQLAAFSMFHKPTAGQLYRQKLARLEVTQEGFSFYDASWVWFGVNFYAQNSYLL